MMELDTINKLFLELSQFATAKTAREIELEDLLVSANAIAKRCGKDTAWKRFSERISKIGVGSITPRTFRVLDSDTLEFDDFIQNRFGYCFYEIKETGALIYNLYVHPKYRQQGKAKDLLQHVISVIRDSGYTGEIEIEAAPKEEGINLEGLLSFYTRMGLKIYGQ